MTGPRTKRQFAGAASDPNQRQITSFFTSRSDFNHSYTTPTSPEGSLINSHASLPDAVQSNLISVGMRIRKSVPEGYKTGTTHGAFGMWSMNNKMSLPQVPTTPFSSVPLATTASQIASRRELLPFCGIHTIGGLSSQPESSSFDADLEFDDFPGLTSTQETVQSVDDFIPSTPPFGPVSRPINRRKRSFSEDDLNVEEFSLPTDRGSNVWMDGVEQVFGSDANWQSSRPMAVPKGYLQRGGHQRLPAGTSAVMEVPAQSRKPEEMDQENMVVDDFEEASFLDYQSWQADEMDDL